ncbi:MAG: hypothetical protein C3F11_02235 [Methylocystaceae bacterium]|nr:MAG: hypothetical protein C3F11_02235 [Methylocystaceae bacterium]
MSCNEDIDHHKVYGGARGWARVCGLILSLVVPHSAEAGFDEGEAALNEGDASRAIREFAPLAEKGEVKAQWRLAVAYEIAADLGLEFEKGASPVNLSKAAYWYSRAAEGNNVAAERRLAQLLRKGLGVVEDSKLADQWDRRANENLRREAEQGSISAQRALAFAYSAGLGIPRDGRQAAVWRRKAAMQGDAEALNELGVQYSRGDEVEQDDMLAYVFFALAKKAAQVVDDSAVFDSNLRGVTKRLSSRELVEGEAIAEKWKTGTPLPETRRIGTK